MCLQVHILEWQVALSCSMLSQFMLHSLCANKFAWQTATCSTNLIQSLIDWDCTYDHSKLEDTVIINGGMYWKRMVAVNHKKAITNEPDWANVAKKIHFVVNIKIDEHLVQL